MELKSSFTNRSGNVIHVVYRDDDPTVNLGNTLLQAVHAYCFYKDKMVIVYSEAKGYWTPPGGGIEAGESIPDAVAREIQEETNMKILYQEILGYQDLEELHRVVRQARSFCIVEPIGDFIRDPGGDVTDIKLIDPRNYRYYFNWGIIGDHLLKKAIEAKGKFAARKNLLPRYK